MWKKNRNVSEVQAIYDDYFDDYGKCEFFKLNLSVI